MQVVPAPHETHVSAAWESEVRSELQKVLSSGRFANSARLSRFLQFTVEHTLEGHADELKEMTVAMEVFDRDTSFDPRLDSVVRVQAGRVRSALQEYYRDQGRDDPIRIDLPKGSYAPCFERMGSELGPPPVEAQRRRKFPLLTAGIALSGVLLLLVAVVAVRQLSSYQKAASLRVAVLPFDNLSSDPENDYFCAGFLDELTTELAKVHGLMVVARTSASQFKRGEDLTKVGQQLHVGAVIEGSVRKTGDRVRITVQLISATDGTHLWSQTYERRTGDAFTVQYEIAQAVANALRTRLMVTADRRVGTSNAEAQQAYWKARYYRAQRGTEGMLKSLPFYQQAIDKDPHYALAYSGLAEAYATLAFHGVSAPDAQDAIAKAKATAAKALELDDSIAEAQATLASIQFFDEWDWKGAEAAFRRALQLNPSYGRAHNWYALGLASRGRFDEAVAEARKAQELDPLSYTPSNDTGVILYLARRYDECIKDAHDVLNVDPKYVPAHSLLGICYAGRGHYGEAASEFQTVLDQRSERYSYLLGRLGHANAAQGHRAQAEALLQELLQAPDQKGFSFVHVAYIYVGLSDNDRALEALQKAYERRDADLVFIGVEPLLDGLRSDPRFAKLLNDAKLLD